MAGFAVAAAYFVLTAVPALGDNVGTVNAQVTVAAPCLTLSTTTLDFGTIRLVTNPTTDVTGLTSSNYTITNCGAASEKLYAKGTDATSTSSNASWSLANNYSVCNLGPNYYGLGVGEDSGVVGLTKQSQALPTALPGGGTKTYNNSISSPCVGSGGAGETMTMQIMYTVAF
jgi:hypothetical protein